MKKVVVLGDRRKPYVRETFDNLAPWLGARAEILLSDLSMEADVRDVKADFALVLGGDGAILSAARRLGKARIPLLGVNLGKLGFLAETALDGARDAIERVLDGDAQIVDRMMLRCRIGRGGETLEETLGLNDAVVSRGALSRLIAIRLNISGEDVTTYRADGLIVATPVGSTAHSLAAGGPILEPELRAMVIAPICPHTLSNRPIVIGHDSVIRLTVEDNGMQPSLTVDGQVYFLLEPETEVEVSAAPETLRLLRVTGRSFYETLRSKLGWGGHPNYAR